MKMLIRIGFLCACFVFVFAVKGKVLPSYFPQCYLDDPKVSECLLKATETVKPFLKKGVPELNFPALEPFYIPEVSLEQGTQALNFKAVLTNIRVDGLSNYKFSQFDFDVPNLQWFCKAVVEPLKLSGDYKVTGKVLLAPIEGNGTFTASIKNSNITMYQKAQTVMKKGVEYVQPIWTNSSIQVGGPEAHLEGLFNGNEELNRATNQVINDNVNELFEDLRPVIEKVITKLVEDLLLGTLEANIPFRNLYPNMKKN